MGVVHLFGTWSVVQWAVQRRGGGLGLGYS